MCGVPQVPLLFPPPAAPAPAPSARANVLMARRPCDAMVCEGEHDVVIDSAAIPPRGPAADATGAPLRPGAWNRDACW